MKIGDGLTVLSHIINVTIFTTFSITLIKINAIDTLGLSITAFGILMSLIANIISIIEK